MIMIMKVRDSEGVVYKFKSPDEWIKMLMESYRERFEIFNPVTSNWVLVDYGKTYEEDWYDYSYEEGNDSSYDNNCLESFISRLENQIENKTEHAPKKVDVSNRPVIDFSQIFKEI